MYRVEGVPLILTRGTPLYSLLFPASTLSLLPLLYTLWGRGSASSSHLRHAPSLSVFSFSNLPFAPSTLYIRVEGVLLYPYLERG